jgi:LEA14-like dessication related protein
MKALPTIAVLAAGGYLLAKGWNTAQAVKRLEYSNPKIKLGKIGLTRIELQMTIDLRNSGSADIPLQYFTGNINYLFGTPVQPYKISSFTFNPTGSSSVVVKARTITTVPFTVVISNLSTIQTITKLIQSLTAGGKVSTLIQVDGSMYAAGIDIPVQFNYDIKNNVLSGIGNVKASLEFSSNAELEKYFTGKRIAKKMIFSKN